MAPELYAQYQTFISPSIPSQYASINLSLLLNKGFIWIHLRFLLLFSLLC